jgi:hypothetical protein
MKLDLAAHDEDAHGAIKTADGRLVVPFVLLLASIKGDRPWRMAVQYLKQRLGSAWPQSWYWLRPGDHPEDMADWLKQQHELLDYQNRQQKSGRGAVAFMATELNEQIKTGQIRRKAKRLELPLPGDAEDLPGLLDCRLFDAAALERATDYEALRAGDHGRAAIDLEDVRRVFPELEIVGDGGAEAIFRRMESAGAWPRRKAEKGCKAPAWTDAEREAAFELRHLWGVSDVVLKDRIGLSRQRINEAIGGKTKTSAIQGARDGWKAPIELLRRCGFLVHEMTLQDARKPAPLSARKAA